ncbi:circularly permuted type 2 ATP-grasp protein [Dietzia sp. Die43]|uniref:circularly permuted type 2 ATP-grasp protein n=1 Tax=Dietzia TaxID=37914 RepID=UPI002119ADE8|nr:circularly permuted type 2 ATP-grasp protein [Dietzia sp. Die43]
MSALDRAGTVRLRSRQVTAEKEASVAGVTFRVTGQERPQAFPMDFVPRIISPEVWRVLAAGTEQRARALDAFLDDIYGQREFVRAGHMTPESLDRAPVTAARDAYSGRVGRGRTSAGSTWCAGTTARGSCWRTTSGCPPGSPSPTPCDR